MAPPDLSKWGQWPSDVRILSVEADHWRSRERFQTLYMIASGQATACGWARTVGRATETVLRWVLDYNRSGPEAVFYRHTGGRRPFSATGRLGNS